MTSERNWDNYLMEMVGRDAELGRLLALLDDAEAGRSVVALVGGDAGVGKTRLTTEVATLAAARGFTVLTGQCAQIGDSVPYLPIADALRAPAIRDAVAARQVLGWMLPGGNAGEMPEKDWSGLARQQMFGAVLGLLAEMAAEHPVALVLEDLHWADASTRALFTFLSRVLHRERIVIIGTYRADDLHRRHPLLPVLAELRRLPTVTTIDLGPLAAAALAEHLSSMLPNGRGNLDAATMNSLVERAEGNAYYAEELFADTVSQVRPARGGGTPADPTLAGRAELPSGLAALLLARVERVGDGAQRVLRAAAVAGRRVSDDLVRAASGLSDDEYDEAIREAVAHQLLVPDADGYAFRHALLREAVYNDLMPGERTRLHATFASLLASRSGSAAELAHHCLASHDIPGAFAASVRAGAESDRRAAPAEAHRHYDQALALWERVADPEALAGISRAKLALKSATAAAASGDVPRAVQQFRRAWSLVGPGSDPEERSRLGERLAYFLLQIDTDAATSEALTVAREVVSVTPEQPPTWYRARALATLATALLYAGETDQAADWAEHARAAARAAGTESVEADSLITLGTVANISGLGDEAVRLYTAAHEQARNARVLGVELRAAYNLAAKHLSRGELAEAARVAHEGVQRAEETGLGLAPFGLDVQHLHFQAHFAQGEWDHAAELAAGFVIRVTSLPEALLSSMALFIDVARGDPVVPERLYWLAPYWEDTFCAYISRGLLAEYKLWRGDAEAALAEASAALDVERRREQQGHGLWPSVIRPAAVAISALADRARAARVAGDAAGASAAVDEAASLLELAQAGAVFGRHRKAELGPEGRGWLACASAEYARAQGENDPGLWRATMDAFGPEYVYECARTRWRLAEALAESGSREEAAGEWGQAREVAVRLGARPLQTALDDLARRARLPVHGASAGAASPGSVSSTSPGAGGTSGGSPLAALTEREREVLDLLAEGRSNREIAAALFIATKTASVHVSNILAKLGASSRTEAAAIARGAQGNARGRVQPLSGKPAAR
jgi:DNA-binding CsgD family transcriptional regulator/tetratricopeptide (TPR) repeat protein